MRIITTPNIVIIGSRAISGLGKEADFKATRWAAKRTYRLTAVEVLEVGESLTVEARIGAADGWNCR